MPYTILRSGFLMEVWLSPMLGFDPLNARAEIYGTGEQSIRWISVLDVARYAVASLENPYAIGAVRTLTGPEPISPRQVIGLFEREGRSIFEVTRVPVEAPQRQLQDAADPLQKSQVGLKIAYASGEPPDRESALGAFSTRLRTVADYARYVLSTFTK
jgi:nucleoside-diphosphate-sugar epimerase